MSAYDIINKKEVGLVAKKVSGKGDIFTLETTRDGSRLIVSGNMEEASIWKKKE